MNTKGRSVGAKCTYGVLRIVLGIFFLFPLEWNLVTARIIGRIWWFAIPRHRDRARNHLRLAFGDEWTDEQVDRVARQSMQHLVMLAFETAFLPRTVDEWTWAEYVTPKGIEKALEVLLEGKGALLLTGHYGNWELAGYMLATYGFDVVAIMRPLDNEYLNDFVVETRAAKGLRLLDKRGAMSSAEDIVQSGSALGFIADQNAGRKGMFVDFFGTAASTYKSIGLLAMATDTPIIVGYARRIAKGFKYEVGVQRVILPDEWKRQEDPLRWITQEYTTAIEESIREAPEQYLWIHRRWKSRPKGEENTPPQLIDLRKKRK